MVAININGAQTLIPLSMFTKLLQQKNATAQSPTTNVIDFDLNYLRKQILGRLEYDSVQYQSSDYPTSNSTEWFNSE